MLSSPGHAYINGLFTLWLLGMDWAGSFGLGSSGDCLGSVLSHDATSVTSTCEEEEEGIHGYHDVFPVCE